MLSFWKVSKSTQKLWHYINWKIVGGEMPTVLWKTIGTYKHRLLQMQSQNPREEKRRYSIQFLCSFRWRFIPSIQRCFKGEFFTMAVHKSNSWEIVSDFNYLYLFYLAQTLLGLVYRQLNLEIYDYCSKFIKYVRMKSGIIKNEEADGVNNWMKIEIIGISS